MRPRARFPFLLSPKSRRAFLCPLPRLFVANLLLSPLKLLMAETDRQTHALKLKVHGPVAPLTLGESRINALLSAPIRPNQPASVAPGALKKPHMCLLGYFYDSDFALVRPLHKAQSGREVGVSRRAGSHFPVFFKMSNWPSIFPSMASTRRKTSKNSLMSMPSFPSRSMRLRSASGS